MTCHFVLPFSVWWGGGGRSHDASLTQAKRSKNGKDLITK